MDSAWRPCSATTVALPSADEIHLWRIELTQPDTVVERLRPTLDANELARVNRFRTEVLRRRFLIGRGALRSILGKYLGDASEGVTFEYGTHGKPAIAGAGNASNRLEFNLAHTDDIALCAVAVGRPVGVDVESVRPLLDGARIIARYFSAREQSEFLSMPDSDRTAAFYRGWSRKEADLKATGTGISAGLDSFDVTLAADNPRLLRIGDDSNEATRWTLLDVDGGPDLAAAVATPAPVTHIEFWRWSAQPESDPS